MSSSGRGFSSSTELEGVRGGVRPGDILQFVADSGLGEDRDGRAILQQSRTGSWEAGAREYWQSMGAGSFGWSVCVCLHKGSKYSIFTLVTQKIKSGGVERGLLLGKGVRREGGMEDCWPVGDHGRCGSCQEVAPGR